jgi:hypothetical protein
VELTIEGRETECSRTHDHSHAIPQEVVSDVRDVHIGSSVCAAKVDVSLCDCGCGSLIPKVKEIPLPLELLAVVDIPDNAG